ncbi:MAG: penicillin-binding transpeptidase domain-containing protein [Oscillospiraceae bacterium]|nr:penicillin-binding transpeptidase domain-containing protein [Oscillospiraceae bacterium]
MNKISRRAFVLLPLIILFAAGTMYLLFSFYANGAKWSSSRANRHIYSSAGQIATAGAIYDTQGKTLAKTDGGARVYNSSRGVRRATLHVVGDPAGVISTGAHSAYKNRLIGYSFSGGLYGLKHHGTGRDLTLAVNAAACAAALKALGDFNGTVGVYNYKTGALLCSVSAPTYDINSPPKDLLTNEKYGGVFLNRLISGVYTPGSTFKIVTAVSALQNIPGVKSKTFTCNGEMTINGGKLVCMNTHGRISFEAALNKSCNCAFAQIALELGADKLAATAKQLGFNTPRKADGLNLATSTFNLSGADELALAWAGIGQYTTLVNPCHMLMIAGAIANGGQGISPYVVEKITSPGGVVTYRAPTKKSDISIDPMIAAELRTLLRSNVEIQYGDSRFPGLKMCGKTGTAEVEGKKPHSWFVGFSLREDMPYAVVAVAEHAGAGSGAAMQAANTVLQALDGRR